MKKVIIFLIIFLILSAIVVFVLNFFGILDIRELGESILERLPFVTTISQLQKENELLQLKVEILEEDLEKVLSEKKDLQTRMDYLDLDRNKKVAEISLLVNQLQDMRVSLAFKEERLESLISIYREMDPKNVASILTNLDDTIIIQVLTRLRPRDAAAILTHIPAERAAIISKDIFEEEGR